MTEATAVPERTEEEQLPIVVPATPETVAVIVTRATTLLDRVKALVIEDDAGLETAADHLSDVRALRREVAHDLGEPATAARKLWEMIRERFTRHDNPLKAAETMLKDKVGAYHRQRALERQQQIDAADAQAKAHETDGAARDLEAERLMDAGDFEGAQAVLDETPTPAPARPTSAPKTKGISVGETWKAEVLNLDMLIKAAAGGDPTARSCFAGEPVKKAVTAAASKVAKGMMSNMNVPGVRAYPEPRVAAGKR